MSFKVYEGYTDNGMEYTDYILEEKQRKSIYQKNGIAYIDYWNGRNWDKIEFATDKKTIRQNYILCKDKEYVTDYFGTGRDLIIYTKTNGEKMFAVDSRWQGENPFTRLLLYGEDSELILKLEKEFGKEN